MTNESSNVRWSGGNCHWSMEAKENELDRIPIHNPPPRTPLNTIADPSQCHIRRHSLFSDRKGASVSAKLSFSSSSSSSRNGTRLAYDSCELPHFELQQDSSFWGDHNVQVLIRIRPLSWKEEGQPLCLRQESPHTLLWLPHPPETRFTFDHVASHTISQVKFFFFFFFFTSKI